MSQERETLTPTGTKTTSEEVKKESHVTQKARIASVLARGVIADHLRVDLPPDKYGEWVPNDQAEIHRMHLLGFEIDTTYANKRSSHGDGTSKNIIGDTIFMVTSKENKEIIDEVVEEQKAARNAKKSAGQRKAQGEEKEFVGPVERLGIGGAIVESEERVIRKQEIEQALRVK